MQAIDIISVTPRVATRRLGMDMSYDERNRFLQRWREKKGKAKWKTVTYKIRDDDPTRNTSWSTAVAVLRERYKNDPAFLQKIAVHGVGIVSTTTDNLIFDDMSFFNFRVVPLCSTATPYDIKPNHTCPKCKLYSYIQVNQDKTVRCLKCQYTWDGK